MPTNMFIVNCTTPIISLISDVVNIFSEGAGLDSQKSDKLDRSQTYAHTDSLGIPNLIMF